MKHKLNKNINSAVLDYHSDKGPSKASFIFDHDGVLILKKILQPFLNYTCIWLSPA